MLEKEILQKVIDLLPISDVMVARKMLERSGVRFIFSGGKSGTYSQGMLKLDGGGGLSDFNVGGVTGFILAEDGPITSGLEVGGQVALVQDLRNQLVQIQDEHQREYAVLHKELARNENLLAEGAKLLADANQRLESFREEINAKTSEAASGEGEAASSSGEGEGKLAASGEDADPNNSSGISL